MSKTNQTIEIKENPVKRWTDAVVTIMLVLAVLLCLYVVVQVLSRGHVSLGGYSVFRVVTGSMEPTMSVGALLLSKEVPIESIQVGDIICFKAQDSAIFGKMMTHRVLGVHTAIDGSLFFETKGDANLAADAYFVTKSNFVGKIVWHTGEGNMLSSIFALFTNKVGFLACIVIPCLLLASMVLRDCVKNIRSELEQAMHELEEYEDDPLLGMSQEECEEMYKRIRAELMEELVQGGENKKKQ